VARIEGGQGNYKHLPTVSEDFAEAGGVPQWSRPSGDYSLIFRSTMDDDILFQRTIFNLGTLRGKSAIPLLVK
jgi:hypothetical protein